MSSEPTPSGWREPAAVVAAVAAVAGIGSAATVPAIRSRWYRRLDTPPWQPPGGIFGPVWTVLYALLAASAIAGLRWTAPAERRSFRILLGVGISHRAPMDRIQEGMYSKPYSAMVSYLDTLDAAPEPPPHDEIVIAALGPRMLRLSAERAAGTHPYLTTPEHTRIAREAVGPGKLVAPEQGVVLETDPERARALARGFLELYLPLPNYFRTWERLGFTEEDRRDGGSDRLVDGLIAWGGDEAIAARVREHLDAGADHVCLQVIHDEDGLPTEQWRRMAEALIG
jgi:probable F420-dependent oxidoreductase